MREDQVKLQLINIVFINANGRKLAKARVDSVDRRFACPCRCDNIGRPIHARARRAIKLQLLVTAVDAFKERQGGLAVQQQDAHTASMALIRLTRGVAPM